MRTFKKSLELVVMSITMCINEYQRIRQQVYDYLSPYDYAVYTKELEDLEELRQKYIKAIDTHMRKFTLEMEVDLEKIIKMTKT